MDKKGLVLWSVLLALLIGVIVYVNLPARDAGENTSPAGETAGLKEGADVGEALPDFTVDLLDGGVFRLSDCRGKTVVINVWATWCGPCVKELPDFQKLYAERGDGLVMLALHADTVTEDVSAYIKGTGFTLPAAVADAALLRKLGYIGAVPQTVIVGPNGAVAYNSPGAIDYETLVMLVEKAKQ